MRTMVSKTTCAALLTFPILLTLGCEPGGKNRIGGSGVARQAIAAPPEYSNPKAAGWNQDGVDHLKREHWRKAAADFKRALELDPALAAAHFNLALSLQTQGKDSEAEGHYRLAILHGRDDPKIMRHQAVSELLKKDLR